MHTRTVALVSSLLAVLVSPASAAAGPAGEPPVPVRAFVEPGLRDAAAAQNLTPPSGAFVEKGLRVTAPPNPSATQHSLPTRPRLAPEDPPPPPTKEECRNQPDAETRPGDLNGWYKDRYGWCAYGDFEAPGTDAGTGQVVANFSADFTVIGYGNNGARQFDYLVYLDDIKTSGSSVNWDLAVMKVSVSGCNASMTCPNTSKSATVPAWKAVNTAAFTFTSAEIAGGGPQIVGALLQLNLDFATPAQPEWVWGNPNGVAVAESPVRYDSASYVGRARGAIFPNYQLVFSVDLRQANQNESALHILHALDRPELTWPSWPGKSVPGKTQPLTRMYNEPAKNSNRAKSEAMCRSIYGTWDSRLDNCDEFPFASTYEGSKTGPDTNHWGERYSVRLISAADNQHVGNILLEVDFYRALRVLDGEKFYVAVRQ